MQKYSQSGLPDLQAWLPDVSHQKIQDSKAIVSHLKNFTPHTVLHTWWKGSMEMNTLWQHAVFFPQILFIGKTHLHFYMIPFLQSISRKSMVLLAYTVRVAWLSPRHLPTFRIKDTQKSFRGTQITYPLKFYWVRKQDPWKNWGR